MLDVEESPGCTAADGGSRSVSGATATVPALVEVASDMTEIGANTPPRVVECSCNVNARKKKFRPTSPVGPSFQKLVPSLISNLFEIELDELG